LHSNVLACKEFTMPLPQFPPELENRTWQTKKSKSAGDNDIGETGIGEQLDELAAVFKRIDADTFASLEDARSLADLEQWAPRGDDEMTKVRAATKAIRDFAQFAERKAAELRKTKRVPKDTLKLIEQMGEVAEAFDEQLLEAAVDIRQEAADRLAAHADQARKTLTDADTLAVQLMRLPAVAVDRPWHFVLALGNPSGLALTRSPITLHHRNAANALRDGTGKLIEGTCHGEGAFCVFVIDQRPPAGLARNIAKAALVRAGRKIRVRVRGGGIELDDATDTAAAEGVAQEASVHKRPAPISPAPSQGSPTEPSKGPSKGPSKDALMQRIREMTKEVKQRAATHAELEAALKKRLTDAVQLLQDDHADECEAGLAEVSAALERLRKAQEPHAAS
jgi:hypothetical protein